MGAVLRKHPHPTSPILGEELIACTHAPAWALRADAPRPLRRRVPSHPDAERRKHPHPTSPILGEEQTTRWVADCTFNAIRPANSPSPAAGEVRWGFCPGRTDSPSYAPDAERHKAVPTRERWERE